MTESVLLSSMSKLVQEMSLEELLTANKMLVEIINTRYKIMDLEATTVSRIGDQVQFLSRKRGRILKGTVKKINSRTITVDVDGVRWKVAASYLKPISSNPSELF